MTHYIVPPIEIGYSANPPSLATRFWGWLGFGRPIPPDTEEIEIRLAAKGWIGSTHVLNFDFGDRVRILFGGRAIVIARTVLDTPVGNAETVSTVGVLRPDDDGAP